MPSQKDPDDKNRSSRPQEDGHEKQGTPITHLDRFGNARPIDQFGNVVATTAEEDEKWDRMLQDSEEETNRLPEEERAAVLRRTKLIVESAIRKSTGSAVEQPPGKPSTEPEKRSWAKETDKNREAPGFNGNIPRA